jgi:hypothetical protein
MEECYRSTGLNFTNSREFVAPEFMLLGILREVGCDAAQLLTLNGLALEEARKLLSNVPPIA